MPTITEVLEGVRRSRALFVRQQAAVLEALHERYGDGVHDVVREASAAWFAALHRSPVQPELPIADRIAALWEPLASQGYTFTLEKAPGAVRIRCTACPLAETYRAAGSAEWGYRLYCAADERIARTIDPRIRFAREHTLMEGHPCCDHVYCWDP